MSGVPALHERARPPSRSATTSASLCPVAGSSVLVRLFQLAQDASEVVIVGGEAALGRLVTVERDGTWIIDIAHGRMRCSSSSVWTASEAAAFLTGWEGNLPDYVATVQRYGLVGLKDLAQPIPTRAARPRTGLRGHDVNTILVCPRCERNLVAPRESVGMVQCPKCAHAWDLLSHVPAKPVRVTDTHADRLNYLKDTLPDCAGENAIREASATVMGAPEQLAKEVCAELDRRRMPYLHENVRAFVVANCPATANPSTIADSLQAFAEWLATGLWQGEAPIEMWRD